MEKLLQYIKRYKCAVGIIGIATLVLSGGVIFSWIQGDKADFFSEYIEKSNSDIVKGIRESGMYVVGDKNPIYIAQFSAELTNECKNILENSVTCTTFKDGLKMDTSEEVSVPSSFIEGISNKFNGVSVKLDGEKVKKVELNNLKKYNIEVCSNIMESNKYIILKYVDDESICKIDNENVNVDDNIISCIAQKKGKTQLNIMLVYDVESIIKHIDIVVE